ncbi:MAG: hypothetical protein R3F61_08850 [Myxococcota bacterium]
MRTTLALVVLALSVPSMAQARTVSVRGISEVGTPRRCDISRSSTQRQPRFDALTLQPNHTGWTHFTVPDAYTGTLYLWCPGTNGQQRYTGRSLPTSELQSRGFQISCTSGFGCTATIVGVQRG